WPANGVNLVGPQGPAGPSDVYINKATASTTLSNTPESTIASVTVPAGSYLLIAKTGVYNVNATKDGPVCSIKQGAAYLASVLVDAEPHDNVELTDMATAANVPANTTFNFVCTGAGDSAAGAVLTATATGAVHSQ